MGLLSVRLKSVTKQSDGNSSQTNGTILMSVLAISNIKRDKGKKSLASQYHSYQSFIGKVRNELTTLDKNKYLFSEILRIM